MVRRSVWRHSIATLCAVGLALGCASTPEEDEGQTDIHGGGSSSSDGGGWEEPGGTGGAIRSGTATGGVVGVQDAETAALQQRLRTVYFDYDRATLTPAAADALKGDAEVIKGFPAWAKVTVQGHCDERGTEEYNLALGDRRADAVKRYLLTLGVSPDQLETVSYGELQPATVGHDETAWKDNRRVEFAVSR